jgi:uncharacterized DUF497 family protein
MEFEFDINKSNSNKLKHGIDFIEIQKIFIDTNTIIPAKIKDGEIRYIIIGLLDEKCWSCVFTIRNDIIRIISARRCRKKEKELL